MTGAVSAVAADRSSLLAGIDALNRSYGHAIDDGDYERWPGFFVEDALYKITTRWNHDRAMPAGLMLCQGRAMMEDRVSALRTANIYEPHRYRHLIDPPACIGNVRRQISATASFAVYRTMQSGAPEIFCTGKYVDEDRRGRRPAEILREAVVCDGEHIDTMIVLPL